MKKTITSLLLLGLSILTHGCIFKDLKQELETFEGTYAISGRIVDHARATGPIIAVLLTHNNERRSIPKDDFRKNKDLNCSTMEVHCAGKESI